MAADAIGQTHRPSFALEAISFVRFPATQLIISACLLGSTVVTSPASAAITRTFHVANWAVSVYSQEHNKQFDRCSGGLTNASGVTLSYSINRYYTWAIALSSPLWKFTPGNTFRVMLKLGERDYFRQPAAVVGNNTLDFQVSDSLDLFERLRVAARLQVLAGGLASEFDLQASGEVLSALVQCVAEQTNGPKPGLNKKSNPFSSGSGSDAATRAEAAALAVDIVTYAGIAAVHDRKPVELPGGLQAHATWKAGAVTGAMSILRSGGTATIKDLARRFLDDYAKTCGGKFFAASSMDAIDYSTVVRIFTFCQTAEETATIYYLAIPRANGGLYLVATMTNLGDFAAALFRPAADVDSKIRAVITRVLSKERRSTGAP